MRAWSSLAVLMLFAGVASAEPAFERVDLVSDGAVAGTRTDANLVNPWGLAASPTSPWWVANNGTGTATLYDGAGNPQPLVVTVPGSPTGEVFYGGDKLIVSDLQGNMGPARFIFASEDGTVSAWSPAVPPPPPSHAAFVMYDGSDENDVYKGLAIATDRHGRTRLYATDFHNARVVVLDDTFTELELGEEAFDDDRLPAGYAPFGIQAFGQRIFVTYALQDADKHDDVPGAGHGFVDEYDLDGRFIRRVASRGALNSPWGLAAGPESFGRFDDDLLVGNFGDGRIHAYKQAPWGHFYFAGTLRDEHGKAIVIDGLWSIAPGNGAAAGSKNDLYFTAGINGEADGLFGLIRRDRDR
ncbi:MAG: hypothetical protein JWM53_5500 [bacterium]|nr:hypothetical protein [bacterium]